VGVFTSLGELELLELAKAFGIGAVRESRVIAAGTINSNFALTTESGEYFLRINEGKAEADVAWEARLVTALAEAGVPTPPPLVALDGLPYARVLRKWASVFPWRGGTHVAAGDVTTAMAETFGAALAGLHVAGLALPTAWRRGSIYDHDHLVTRFERFARVDDKALSRAVAILREELAVGKGASSVRKKATHGIIHGDLFRDNVLWDGPAISAILDFEQASGGSLVYDLGVCINDWCWTIYPRIDLATALVRGYQSVRPLTEADREALPIEIRAAAARFTLTRITDVYLARVDNPDKDFRAFLARCEAWRGPALGQLTAAV
jgi:homoserine kinase type II